MAPRQSGRSLDGVLGGLQNEALISPYLKRPLRSLEEVLRQIRDLRA